MKIAVQPFFSQQNKATGHFLLDGCLTVRISLFMAQKLQEEGHEVEVYLPELWQRAPWKEPALCIKTRRMPQSNRILSNKLQRLDFDAAWWEANLADVDLLLTCNELLPAKVRHVFDGKIAVLNNLFPMGGWEWMRELQQEAWHVADCVAFMSEFIRDQMYRYGVVWPLVYDATKIQTNNAKDIDVLFVQRCSVNNYTHHEEFIAALPALQGLRVVFADPTGYLEKQRPDLEYAHAFQDKYYSLLARTRVVVAIMTGDIHGGTSVREAIVSGANPVFLDYPHYRDIVRDAEFDGWCTLEPDSIAEAVHRQMQMPVSPAILARVAAESYQAAWPKISEALCRL